MRLQIAAATFALLAGCGSQSANQQSANQQAGANPQAAPEQTATSAAGGSGSLTIQPGLWEITMDMRTAQASGMPAGVHMPQIPPTTVQSCVTPEQVSRANANFLSGSGHTGMDCDYSGVTVAGGRIQGTSVCRRTGIEARVTMDGSFTPTSYDINQQMQSTMHGRSISSTNHLVGRRVGECPAGQANAAPSVTGDSQSGK
jgi:Protein of unknown function (DUF3617)